MEQTKLKFPLGANPKLDELMVLVAVSAATESGNGYDLDVLKRHAEHAAHLWDTRPSPSPVTDEPLNVQQVFALEGADELEQLGKRAQGMISAIPAIVAEERIEQHNAAYESEAKRWFRLAKGVRACVAASDRDVLVARIEEMREALEECRLIVAHLPHGEELLLAKIDKALSVPLAREL